jgi:hypothetical protein
MTVSLRDPAGNHIVNIVEPPRQIGAFPAVEHT